MIVTVTLNPSLDEWVELPQLYLGELNRATAFKRYPGGKGINVARVVHELKARALAVALAGGDDGKILKNLLDGLRIPTRFVTVPGTTRNNYQIRTDSPKALTQINCPGPKASASALDRLERLLGKLRPSPSCVVLSGSLPPGAPTDTYARLIRACRRHNVPAVLDTSGPALRVGIKAAPWLIKPNRQEAEELLERPIRRLAQAAKAAWELVARGPSLAIISLGADGAVLASQSHPRVFWATPPKVPVQSAVGAGDSLVAGFVVGWLRTHSLERAFRLGMACGSATVMTPGTELCHRVDVQRLLRRIQIVATPCE